MNLKKTKKTIAIALFRTHLMKVKPKKNEIIPNFELIEIL